MWDALPTELCGKILTYVSLHDLFTVRSVSWRWRNLAERQTFYCIREQNMANTVEFANESSCIQVKMYATSFDAANGVITFQCRESEQPSKVLLATRRSGVILPVHPKFMTIRFQGWDQESPPINAMAPPEQLSEKEKERYRLHSSYNYAHERALELPSWDKIGPHLVGDHDHILSFAYLDQPQSNHEMISNSTYPLFATFHWLKVSFSWLAAGLAIGFSHTPIDQIFASRYSLLSSQLAKHGCFKYDATSEPVLRYITHDQNQSFCDLVEYIRTHDMETRLSRLQHALPAVGVDYRMIWKYPFAKAFVTGRALLLSEDDVIRGIEGGEQECKSLLQSVSKRRNCERVIREQQRRRIASAYDHQ
ncbi:hypothetical protein BGW37DRAFT_58775 [Umbelopsis sp. PMI_123]|nr:hypothetical protein BGW37DRAFT_58775 [Umbelopsis sp. PMI_123]